MPESSKRPVKESSKMPRVFRDAVRQISFEVCPDKFVGVKLGGVSGEVKGINSRVFREELMYDSGSMNRTFVPEKHNGAFDMPAEMLEELSDLPGPDISIDVESRVESKPFSFWRDSDGGDSRHLGPASGDNERWSSSFDRPGFPDIGNERESALIQEGQAGSKQSGLFLYAAKRDVSSSESPLPAAPWRVSAASDSSSPGRSSDSTGFRYNNVHGNSSGLSDRYVSVSKDLSNNRPPEALLPGCSPKSFSVLPTEVRDALYWESVLIPCGLSSCSFDASAPRNLRKRALPGPLYDKDGPVSTSGWQDAAAFPKSGVCHGVS